MESTVVETANQVAESLSGVDLSGVLGEMLALVPILMPVAISFIAIRKAISFVLSTLRDA